MKKLKKSLAFLLAALMIMSMLVACGGVEDEKKIGDDDGLVTGTPEDPKLPKKDYGGYEFTFITQEGSSYNTEYLVSEGEDSEILDNAIIRRNNLLEEKYNVTVCQLNVSDIITEVRTQVMGGVTEFDVILAACSKLAVMAQENLLLNLLNVDTFNWDKSYWDSNSKDQLMIGDKLYFANCALNTHSIGFCVFFNKQMVENFKLTSPYEYMEKNEWTIDNWAKMVTSVSVDLDQDGKMTEWDQYGTLMEHHNPRMFLYASGLRATTNDETGYPRLTLMSNGDKTVTLYEKLKEVFANEACSYCIACSSAKYDSSEYPHQFAYLRYLFTQDLYLFHYSNAEVIGEFADMESEFGVVPFPKYNQNQELYQTIYPYGNNLLALPSLNEDLERTAVLLEDMNYISSFTVVPAWFDTLLTRRYARDDESEESLHLLRNNCVYDIGLYYDFGGLRVNVLDADPRYSNISRNYARFEKAINASIKGIYKNFGEFE